MAEQDGKTSPAAHTVWAITYWLAAIGILVSAMSIISMIVRVVDVGLRPVLAEMVDFYRILASPLYRFLQMFPIHIPLFVGDLLIIYITLVAADIRLGVLMRSYMPELSRGQSLVENSIGSLIFRNLQYAFGFRSGALSVVERVRNKFPEISPELRDFIEWAALSVAYKYIVIYTLSLLALIASVVLFFAANRYLPI